MIKVVEKPHIKFSADKTKLKKTTDGDEHTNLKWEVSNAQSVSLLCGDEILSTSTSAIEFKISPKQDATYTLVAIGLDGKTEFSESVSVIVREPANVIFEADKNFTLPNVPVSISWSVKNANHVEFEGTDVPKKGQTVCVPIKDTLYHLTVKDDFGRTDYKVDVRMLPLPVVKSVLVDTPHINNAVGIHYTAPHFEDIPNIPVIKTMFEKLELPTTMDLKECGLFVDLPTPNNKNLLTRISKFIKQIIK